MPLAETQAETIQRIISSIPYPEQIKDMDLTSDTDSVRFTWSGIRFRVKVLTMSTDEVQGSLAIRSNTAILLQALLK